MSSMVGNLSQIRKPQVLASGSAKYRFDSDGRNSVFLGHGGAKLQLRAASQRSLRKHQLRVSAEVRVSATQMPHLAAAMQKL